MPNLSIASFESLGFSLSAWLTIKLASFALALAALRILANRFGFYHNKLVFCCIIALAFARIVVSSFPSLPLQVITLVLDVLLSCSAAYVLASMIAAFSKIVTEWFGLLSTGMVLCAALVLFFISSLGQTIAAIICDLALCLAILLLLYFMNEAPLRECVTKDESKKRRMLSGATTIAVGVFGAGFGTAIFFVVHSGSLIAATLGLMLGAFICATNLHYDSGVNGEKLTKLIGILQIVCLLAVPFVAASFQIVIWTILLALFIWYLLFHWNWVTVTGYRFKPNMVYHLSKSERSLWIGIAFGFGISGAVDHLSFPPLIIEHIMVLLLVSSIIYFIANDADNLRLFTYIIDKNSEPRDAEHKERFYERCIMTANTYGLSLRETEVLILMAKGRNAGFIQKELVISIHTAKSHIHNIYKKIGVSSRQQLIDLIDRRR
jgi:DNA-binding CsgD family transcriptional regulator